MDALQIGVVLLGGANLFIYNNIIQPLTQSLLEYISSGQILTDMQTFGKAMIDAIATGIKVLASINTFIAEQIVNPFAQGIADSLQSGIIWENLKIFGKQMIDNLKASVTETIPNFIKDNIVDPLAAMITTTDWSGVLNNLIAKGAEIITGLKDSMVKEASTIGQAIIDAINDFIPNSVGINIRIPNPITGGDLFNGGVNVDLPDTPFQKGTSWTGNIPKNQAAGVVHGQEGVVSAGGAYAKIMPGPGGFTVEGLGGGNGAMVIQNINIYGVQNAQKLYDELEAIRRGRTPTLGAL